MAGVILLVVVAKYSGTQAPATWRAGGDEGAQAGNCLELDRLLEQSAGPPGAFAERLVINTRVRDPLGLSGGTTSAPLGC